MELEKVYLAEINDNGELKEVIGIILSIYQVNNEYIAEIYDLDFNSYIIKNENVLNEIVATSIIDSFQKIKGLKIKQNELEFNKYQLSK